MAIGTAASLLALAPTAISAAGRILPTEIDRAGKKRLAELQRAAEADALGLNETERNLLLQQARTAREGARRAQEAQRRQQLAGYGVGGSGEALASALAAEEAAAQDEQLISQQVAAEDLKRAAEQEQELVELLALRSQRQLERRASLADVAQKGSDVLLDAFAFSEAVGADGLAGGLLAARRARIAQEFKVDAKEAEEIEQFYRENPHLAPAGYPNMEAAAAGNPLLPLEFSVGDPGAGETIDPFDPDFDLRWRR